VIAFSTNKDSTLKNSVKKSQASTEAVQAEITLYTYATSPFGAKTYFYLIYKRLPFKLVYVHPIKRSEISFTKQSIIPVLKIDNEWRLESSDHGHWLDEMFPTRGILGETEQERQTLIALEAKISSILMPCIFRSMAQRKNLMEQLREGWNLGSIMHQTSKTPAILVPIWPFLIRRVQFLKQAAFSYAPDASRETFQQMVFTEFERLIGDGPFIGGRASISQADLTAYSAVYVSSAVPLTGAPRFLERPALEQWARRVEARLPESFTPRLFSKAPDRVAMQR
jgi:glutathione S-transferase